MINTLDDKGFALLTVVFIGAISMMLLSMVFVVLTMSTDVSGMDKRYLTELESAKGASEFIMASLRNASLTCGANNAECAADTNPPNNSINLPNPICTPLGKANCAGLTATFLSQASFTSADSTVTVVAVQVTSAATSSPEQAIVEFVYKTF